MVLVMALCCSILYDLYLHILNLILSLSPQVSRTLSFSLSHTHKHAQHNRIAFTLEAKDWSPVRVKAKKKQQKTKEAQKKHLIVFNEEVNLHMGSS